MATQDLKRLREHVEAFVGRLVGGFRWLNEGTLRGGWMIAVEVVKR